MGNISEIPRSTVTRFLKRYSKEYPTEDLTAMLELADEAWFKAREEKLHRESDFQLENSYEDSSFTAEEYEGKLTQSLCDELDYDLIQSRQLARDLSRRYNESEADLFTELQESEFEF